MKTQSRIVTLLRNALLALGLSTTASLAFGGVVDDVTLSQSILGGRRIVAHLHGQLPDQCIMVTNVSLGHPPLRMLDKQIDVHLRTRQALLEKCPASPDFEYSLELGDLADGDYTLNVYENEMLTLSKQVAIPFDLASRGLDSDLHYNLGVFTVHPKSDDNG